MDRWIYRILIKTYWEEQPSLKKTKEEMGMSLDRRCKVLVTLIYLKLSVPILLITGNVGHLIQIVLPSMLFDVSKCTYHQIFIL